MLLYTILRVMIADQVGRCEIELVCSRGLLDSCLYPLVHVGALVTRKRLETFVGLARFLALIRHLVVDFPTRAD